MPRTPGPDSPSARRDGRAERSRQTVRAAAFALLEEAGVGGFSVDEVARRSGVAKTTIYRHWPTREALVLDACATLSASHPVPDTGSLDGDLHAHLTTLATLLQTANWSVVLPSIIDAAERHPEFATVHSEIQRGHAEPVYEIVRRAMQRGELPADTDPAVTVSLLVGPLFFRRWFSREPLDEDFVETVIHQVLARR
jgi:AcrR family transcriptional regulator